MKKLGRLRRWEDEIYVGEAGRCKEKRRGMDEIRYMLGSLGMGKEWKRLGR